MLKQLHMIVLVLGTMTVAMTAAVSAPTAYASTLFGDLGDALDRGVDEANRGEKDGEEAGEDDYPNYNSRCSGEPMSAYCAAWVIGYNKGFYAAQTVSD